MSDAFIAFIAGTLFILAGRWIYANPAKLFQSSLHAGHESPLARWWAKLFATLLIFGGSFTVVADPVGLVVSRPTVVTILGLAAGVLGAAFLRPRSSVCAPSKELYRADRPSRRWTRKGKLFIVTSVGGGLAVTLEAILLPWLGESSLWPDVGLVTMLIVATAMLSEMLLLR